MLKTMLSHDEIRILHLLPPPEGDVQAPIRCDISVVKLSEAPEYEALSYVWGGYALTEKIEVSGRQASITKNLYQALRQLRLPAQTRNLWVDQLCIEQWDLDEKVQQVRHMRKIYTLCSRCLAWLGEIKEDLPLEDARAGFEIFEFLASAMQSKDAGEVPLPPAWIDDPTAIERGTKALKPLLKRNNMWWNRIWTVQEAALPTHFSFVWGPLTLPWHVMKQAILMYQSQTWPESVHRVIQPSSEALVNFLVYAIWIEITRRRMDNPLELICRWRDREATDPRDNIFGLLGLCEPEDLPRTRNRDYNDSVASVFRTLTVDLIINEKGLRPLIVDLRPEENKATPAMPRWALDLAGMPTHYTDWYYHSYGYAVYNADKGLQPLDVDQISECVSGDGLMLRGVRIDTIVLAQKAYETTNPSRWDIPIEPVASAMQKLHSVVEDRTDSPVPGVPDPYPSGCSRSEAFARLMLGDVVRNEEQYPGWWANDRHFHSVRKLMDNQSVDQEIMSTVRGMLANRAFFLTETGLMGLGHLETQAGNQVWVFGGGKVPFVVRPRGIGDDDGYDFVGACYVQGIMQGERLGKGKETIAERTIQVF